MLSPQGQRTISRRRYVPSALHRDATLTIGVSVLFADDTMQFLRDVVNQDLIVQLVQLLPDLCPYGQ